MPAEAEGVVEREEISSGELARGSANDVDVDLRILLVQVECRRHEPVVQGEDGVYPLDGTGSAEHVPRHRLGPGHERLGITHGRANRDSFGDVALGSGGRVGVDVRDVIRRRIRLLKRREDGPPRTLALGIGLGDVVGVSRHARTYDVGVDARPAGFGVLLGLEHQDTGTLAHDEAVAPDVIGA